MAISNDELDKEVKSLSQQIQKITESIEAAEALQKSLAEANNVTKLTLLQKKREILQVQQSIAETQKSINIKKQEGESLKKRQERVSEELLATQMNIDRTSELANYIQSQIDVTKKQKEATESTISVTKQLYDAKLKEVDSAKDNVAYSESQISIAQQQLAASQQNLSTLRAKEAVQKSEISAINAEIRQLEKRGEFKGRGKQTGPTKEEQSLVAALKIKEAGILADFRATKAAREQEVAISKSLTASITDLESGLEPLKAEHAKLQSEASALSDVLTKENVKRLGLVETIGKMESELKDVTNELADSVAATGPLNKELFGLTVAIEENNKAVSSETSKLEELQQAHQRLILEEKLMELEFKKTNNIIKTVQKILNSDLARQLVNLSNKAKEFADSVYATQQRFGVSFDTAATLYTGALLNSAKSFFSAAMGDGPFISSEELLAAGQAYTKQFGTVLQPEEMDRIAKEAKKLGVSSESYIHAKRAFLGTGNEEGVRMRAMSEFAKQGLSAGQAIQFAADNADLLAVAGDKYADSLFKAAAESKKIGVNLRDIEKFANSIVGDFEGSLENFAELSALGVEMDFNQLAQVAATGTPEDMKNLLSEQLSQAGITGEELQTNRQLRLALTQSTGMDEASLLRLAGVAEKPKELTLPEKQLAATDTTNTLLGQAIEILGGFGGIIAPVIGGLSTLAGIAGSIYSFILGRRIAGVTKQLEGLPGPKIPGGVTPPLPPVGGVGGAKIPGPAIPPMAPTGGANLAGTASGASSFSASNVLKGAAAMLVVAASVYVLGKGLQQFSTVNWADMGKAALALGVLTAAAFGLSFIAPAVFVGSLAIAALGASIIPFGIALRIMAPGLSVFGQFITTLSQLNAGQVGILALMGPALGSMAVGLTALGIAAIAAAPGLAILGGLQKLGLLPTLSTKSTGTQETTKPPVTTTQPPTVPQTRLGEPQKVEQKQQSTQTVTKIDTTRLEEKLDKLINAMRGMKIEMNGHEVGYVSMNEARTPIRTR